MERIDGLEKVFKNFGYTVVSKFKSGVKGDISSEKEGLRIYIHQEGDEYFFFIHGRDYISTTIAEMFTKKAKKHGSNALVNKIGDTLMGIEDAVDFINNTINIA